MLKRLRENRKSKKGFTLVELIVVIVIILVLAAVMVPSVTKYVGQSRKANCKADAATTLTQLQADVADFYVDNNSGTAYTFNQIGEATYSDTAITAVGTGKTYSATVDSEGDITAFGYQNGRYYATWSKTTGWAGSCF
ncbi:MAG: prepilin-type N-terminal cleavage/methylation domain-containing protein [Blautia sp.]|uniref:prepilin-type N-terminal cleavage/methylation domain-containing protein n=1 Tax=Blautia sp. TaxID=1955243 RepID=UPI003D8FC794